KPAVALGGDPGDGTLHGRDLLSQGARRGLRERRHLRVLLLRPAADHHRRHRLADQSAGDQMTAGDCELCRPEQVMLEAELAYVRLDNNSLSRGHVLVVPRRHVADFFDMTGPEKASVLDLLDR